MTRQEQMRENYRRLREAGFTAKEADRMRGSRISLIEKAIEDRIVPPIQEAKRKAGQAPKKSKKSEHVLKEEAQSPRVKGRITDDVAKLSPDVVYLNNYTFLLKYLTYSFKTNEYIWKHHTVVSDKLETHSRLIEKAIQQTVHRAKEYNERIFISTFYVSEVFINPHYKKRKEKARARGEKGAVI